MSLEAADAFGRLCKYGDEMVGYGMLVTVSYHYVMLWGSTPTKPETKAALHREANEFMWDLADMRQIKDPDANTRSCIRLYESRAEAENELKRQFLRPGRPVVDA